jgi:hypothetical protein
VANLAENSGGLSRGWEARLGSYPKRGRAELGRDKIYLLEYLDPPAMYPVRVNLATVRVDLAGP